MGRSRELSLFILLCLLTACAPANGQATPANTAEGQSEIASPSLTGSSVVWPVLDAAGCAPAIPAPILKLCFRNPGQQAASPEGVNVALPVILAQDALKQVMDTLPGGEWLPPYPLSISGIPGAEDGAEGIIIVNSSPASDAAAAGLIIVNGLPATSGINAVFIVIQNLPDPLSAEGIIIINNKNTLMATVGAVNLTFDFAGMLENGQPISESGFGLDFNQIAADITQDHYQVSGAAEVTEIYQHLRDFHHIPLGIVWGGLIVGASEDQINSSPITKRIDYHPPPDNNIPSPDDSKTAVVWGGMPRDAVGIIIINSTPAPGSQAEGIIIVNTKDISQVMGIIMEDKPAVEGTSQGVVIQNQPPSDDGKIGLNWNALAWSGMPGSESGQDGIIIINSQPALGQPNSLTGFPIGFGIPEGMTPMMAEGGYGPGPLAFGEFSPGSAGLFVPPAAEECLEVQLSGLPPQLSGQEGGSFPAESLFNVFVELNPASGESGSETSLSSRINPPAYIVCTPLPLTEPMEPTQVTPTSTREAVLPTPTPTPRTGLPTTAPLPTGRSAPTKTPRYTPTPAGRN